MSLEIGTKIKQLRLDNNLTQSELAARCELTKGFISQLERDKTSPSISTLRDILEVLGTNLSDFFNEYYEGKNVFTYEDFVEKYDNDLKHRISWVVPNVHKYLMEPILLEIESGGKSNTYMPHTGEEFGYVLKGEVILVLGSKKMKVCKGDTFYYKANRNHHIENNSNELAVVLLVSTPPSSRRKEQE